MNLILFCYLLWLVRHHMLSGPEFKSSKREISTTIVDPDQNIPYTESGAFTKKSLFCEPWAPDH